MKVKAFTLLELLIVLALISLVTTLLLPVIVEKEKSSLEGYENWVRSKAPEAKTLCVNFRKNKVSINNETFSFPSPYLLKTLVEPDLLVSGENHSKFCLSISKPSLLGLVAKGEKDYLLTYFLFPTGEVGFLKVKESEAETFKDKVYKGRPLEWFNSY